MRKKMPRVLIDNRQKRKRLNLVKISGITSRILNLLGEKKGELSITFVDNKAIAILNRKYLSSPGPTDVLAFPMKEDKGPYSYVKLHPYLLGDVVISAEKAGKQAKRFGEPFEKELVRLITHGILHLIGYKDKKKSDKMKMFDMQEKILSDLP